MENHNSRPQLLNRLQLITLPPGVASPDEVLPGGKMGHNRTLIGPGPSDADNGKPDLYTGSPPLHYWPAAVSEC